MNRRTVLAGTAAALALPKVAPRKAQAAIAEGPFAVRRSEAEWRAMLSDLQYYVMREGGTERAWSSPLDRESRAGMFHCRGCEQDLYSAAHKFGSGTGWPSFWQAQPGAIGTMTDRSFFMLRTECHCSRCGSHLGHIFNDGPQPTGKRHCINGVSLVFHAA